MCKCCSLRCLFIFFNALFLVSGVALITIGALQYSTYSQMGTFARSGLLKISIILIAVGATITLISLFGHVGAFLNNSSMVACFISILIVIIILEILTGATFYIFRSRASLLQMNSAINSNARGAIYEYSPKNRHAINRIQEKFSCCGADNSADWSRSVGWENHGAVPDSCCVVKSEGCGQKKAKVHAKGCISAIKLFLLKNLVWVSAVCIALGVTEVLGVLVGVCFCLNIKQESYETLS